MGRSRGRQHKRRYEIISQLFASNTCTFLDENSSRPLFMRADLASGRDRVLVRGASWRRAHRAHRGERFASTLAILTSAQASANSPGIVLSGFGRPLARSPN